MSNEQAVVQSRFHFNLRSFLFLLAMCSVGFAFVPWFGGGGDAWIYLFLLAVGPLSIWIEFHAQQRTWDFSAGWRDRVAERFVEWVLFSLGPLLVGVGWCSPREVIHSKPPLLLQIVDAIRMQELDVMIVPPLTFLALYADLIFMRWPRPVPLRLPILLFIFSALSVVFFAGDAYLGYNKPRSVVVAVILFNGVAMLALWLYWRRLRNNAGRASFMLLAMLMHCWLFGMAFPMVGKMEQQVIKQVYNYDRLFPPGLAPEVDVDGWEEMKIGLYQYEVAQLLGGGGYGVIVGGTQPSDGPPSKVTEVWQYNWHGGGFPIKDIHDAAYVVWFDTSRRVSAFRPPIGSDENRGGQLRSMTETTPTDETSPRAKAQGRK